MPATPPLLFVYGTLRRGATGPTALRLAEGARWLGEARATGHLFMLDGYPGFVPDPGGTAIAGDLFSMEDPDMLLAVLDDYEECAPHFPQPHEYARIMLDVQRQDGAVTRAWTYAYAWPTDTLRRIASGRFDHLAAQHS
ncbi:gamma-glutamylcyclotransferase [Sphingobium sp. H39-3-25]|uniref:gamma-glutamylcyclotransferase family protein n=1 Tax=Sphingobium arseniciresistens TaxID=3030834 RepID=UPI0023B9B321|nr:gamma-glutamylcyclotransferase [Sphingobium arseniciresistens]